MPPCSPGVVAPSNTRPVVKTKAGSFLSSVFMRDDDPTQSIKLPPLKSKGIHTWTEGEIETFKAFHPADSQARLAFSLMLFTGQRRSDVTRMGRQHVLSNCIHVTQQKTGTKLVLPIHPELQVILAAAANDRLTFLVTDRGAPFSQAGFGNWFRDRCDEAGLAHCSAHGLRKAACRRLAEAGCSEKQIAAISGHLSLSEVQRYTRAADQAKLAEQAMHSMEHGFTRHISRTRIGKPK